ncbi:MAG: phosphomannomutase/phosphoglucomutase [Patescibacteria group bacterium]|nr:phosphomannomutase/phosphoglucomutase [Patescibacteria group bacterium]
MTDKIFKPYDIRGVYGVDFNEKDFFKIIKSVITYIKSFLKKEKITLAFGYDIRLSSPPLVSQAKRAIIDQGVIGVDIGLTTTPSFYFASLRYGYDGGMMITASHNPKEHNGVKMVIRDGHKLIKIGAGSGIEKIKEIFFSESFSTSTNDGRIIENKSVIRNEVEEALSKINQKSLKKFKVVTDTANGMAILYLREFFNRIKVEPVMMFAELDGNFPNHEGNPLKFENLRWLQQRVIQEKADFGIAPDADGDRVFFVDEKGEIIPATIITCLIAKKILEKKPNETIVVDIRYTRNVTNLVKSLNAKLSLTKVGHAFISKKLDEVNGIFAGESSGHFFFRDTGFAESSISVIAYIFEILSQAKKPLSKLWRQYYTSFESGETNFKLEKNITGKEVMEKLAVEFSDGQINWLDGLSVDYPNWRFNLRASNTEPLIRLNVEADNHQIMREKTSLLKNKIISLGGEIE